MTGSEGFFRRWSRLKRSEDVPPESEPVAVSPESLAASPEGPECPEPVVDPATLPAVETLGADSDYRPFLAPGVPFDLRRLALRRAWTSDPVIAGFRGFADYDWDFNAPGYGRLLPVDDIRRLCDAVFGQPPPEPEPPSGVAAVAATPAAPEAETPEAETPEAETSPVIEAMAAPTSRPAEAIGRLRRRHGGATPV